MFGEYAIYCNDLRFDPFCNIGNRKMKLLDFGKACRAPAKMRGEGFPESSIFVINRINPVRQAVIVNIGSYDRLAGKSALKLAGVQ